MVQLFNTLIQAGTISTIAGTGEPGCRGEAVPATAALLNEPKHIAIDAAGSLFIADSENHLVRKVDGQTGIITTIAGTFAGHEPASESGEPFIEDMEEEIDPLADPVFKPGDAYIQKSDISGMVRYVSKTHSPDYRFSEDNDLATTVALNFPSAVAVAEDGTVFIADTWNHRIRRVDPQTGILSIIAGTGQATFYGDHGPGEQAALNEPVALALDQKGHLYIADQSNNRIRMLDRASGIITTVAGTGESGYNGDGAPGPDTAFAGPSGLAVDQEDNVYIADTFSHRIRKLDRHTGRVATVVGGTGDFQRTHESSPNLSRALSLRFSGYPISESDGYHICHKQPTFQSQMRIGSRQIW